MEISNDVPQMLTVKETAVRLRLTEEHTRRLLRSGDLPSIKIGRGWRVDTKVLTQWVADRAKKQSGQI